MSGPNIMRYGERHKHTRTTSARDSLTICLSEVIVDLGNKSAVFDQRRCRILAAEFDAWPLLGEVEPLLLRSRTPFGRD